MPNNQNPSSKLTTRRLKNTLTHYDPVGRTEVAAAIKNLFSLRAEDASKAPFETWIKQFEADGFPYWEAVKIVEAGKDLKKYPGGLAYGDLIQNYKESAPGRIDWEMVWRGVDILVKDGLKQLNEVSLRIAGTQFISREDRQMYKKFLDESIQEDFHRKLEKERELVLNEAAIFANIKKENALIEKAEALKKEYTINKLEQILKKLIERRAPFEVVRIIRAEINSLK